MGLYIVVLVYVFRYPTTSFVLVVNIEVENTLPGSNPLAIGKRKSEEGSNGSLGGSSSPHSVRVELHSQAVWPNTTSRE